MKGLLFCAIFVFIQTLAPVAGVCQISNNQYHYRDKLVLKNNHLLVGQIVQYSQDTLILELSSGNQVTLLTNQVKKVIQYDQEGGNVTQGNPKLSVMKNPAKKHSVALSHGWMLGNLGNNNDPAVGQEISLLYKYNTHKGHVITGGTGLETFDVLGPITYVPVVLGYEYHIPVKMKSSLYLSLRTGYAFAFIDEAEGFSDNKGGFMVNPNIGLLFATNGKVGFFMETGLKFQEASYTFGDIWWGTSEVDIIYKRFLFRFGIIF